MTTQPVKIIQIITGNKGSMYGLGDDGIVYVSLFNLATNNHDWVVHQDKVFRKPT